MTLSETLEPLLAAPGALAAAFVDPQGQTIAHVGDAGVLEVLSAYQSVWLVELRGAAERAGLGEMREVSLDFASRRVLAGEVGDGYFVLVVFDRTGVPSLARVNLPTVRERLRTEIT